MSCGAVKCAQCGRPTANCQLVSASNGARVHVECKKVYEAKAVK